MKVVVIGKYFIFDWLILANWYYLGLSRYCGKVLGSCPSLPASGSLYMSMIQNLYIDILIIIF